jgi:protein O-mannosyl-transferase
LVVEFLMVQILSGKRSITFLLVVLLMATFLIYAPGLTGDFIFDDYVNIVNNEAVLLTQLTAEEMSQAFFSGASSIITRPLSMLSFALNNYFTGLDPFYFKLTNLLVHLLICPGIYLLSKELLILGSRGTEDQRRIQWLALSITAIWALHPLNVSSVLYVVQRMNQLAVLVAVYTLLYYCRFRRRDSCDNVHAWLALLIIGLLTIIGVLFKENAALIVLYILVIEVFLLDFKVATAGHRLFLKLFTIFCVVLPGIGFLILLAASPVSVMGDYAIRDFTLWERLMSEARALWMYVGWILMPDTRSFLFYYDGFRISRGLLDPATTLASLAGLAAAIAFCLVYRRKAPFLCFGIAFFLAGHALESTIISLELVFEHRNYLPAFGLIFAGVHTLTHLPQAYLGLRPATAFLALFLILLAHGTYTEALKWSNTFTHLQSMVSRNPDSHRANYSLGFFYNRVAATTPENSALFDAASFYHRRAAQLDEHAIRSHVGAILADSQNGKPLDPVIVEQLEDRLQNLSLTHRVVNEFSLLADCMYSGYCKFEKAIFARFVTALARNKASRPVVIQNTLAQLGVAVFTVFGNRQDGLAILYLARNVRPALTLVDLQLIQIETGLGNYAQAQRLLDEARQKDGASESLRESLAELEAALIQRQAAP